MSIFSKIKSAVGGKQEAKKPAKKEIKPKKVLPADGIPSESVKPQKPEPIKPVSRKKNIKEIYRILSEPHISEKATYLSDENKYVFKVFKTANKIQVKNAVESLYSVRVKGVNIINEKSKIRKIRNISGHKPGYKKAIVALERGYKIEILPH